MSTEIKIALAEGTHNLSKEEIEEIILDLKNEVEHASNFSIPVQENQQNVEGALGAEWMPILTALLSAPAAVMGVKALASILIEWIKRRPVQLSIEGPKGKVIIGAKNMTGDEIRKVVAKLV